jgi:hypothetical protein
MAANLTNATGASRSRQVVAVRLAGDKAGAPLVADGLVDQPELRRLRPQAETA